MPYNRMVLNGSLGGGVERWSCGINFGNTEGVVLTEETELGDWADSIRTKFATNVDWAPSMKALLGSNGNIETIKTYFYPNPGAPSAAVGESIGGAVAGTGSVVLPPQCSLVFSLLTGIPGRRTRGRTYWPCLTSTISATLKRSGNPTQVALAAAFGEMLGDLGVTPTAVVLRPVVVSKMAPGRITIVNSVSVGDVIDTQRSRRDALQEIRVAAPVG